MIDGLRKECESETEQMQGWIPHANRLHGKCDGRLWSRIYRPPGLRLLNGTSQVWSLFEWHFCRTYLVNDTMMVMVGLRIGRRLDLYLQVPLKEAKRQGIEVRQ